MLPVTRHGNGSQPQIDPRHIENMRVIAYKKWRTFFSALGIAAKYLVTAESPTAGYQNQTTDRRERPNNLQMPLDYVQEDHMTASIKATRFW